MDYAAAIKSIGTYEVEFNSDQTLWNVCSTLKVFIPNEIDGLKPKRDAQLRQAFEPLYTNNDKNLLFLENLIRQDIIIGSHGLAANGTVVPQLVREYAQCMAVCDILREEVKPLKQFQEIKSHYEKLFAALDKKLFESCFVDDIKDLNSQLDLNLNIPDLVKDLKQQRDHFYNKFKAERKKVLKDKSEKNRA